MIPWGCPYLSTYLWGHVVLYSYQVSHIVVVCAHFVADYRRSKGGMTEVNCPHNTASERRKTRFY